MGLTERVGRYQPSMPELAVFVSGVISIGLEILAGRMIAPYFGSSIYTWGTIIGVFLAALSYGYHRGGQQAATTASPRRLAWCFLVTAVYIIALIFVGDRLLQVAVALSLPSRVASLPAVVLLFGPPTYVLGFISPYGAELSRKEGLGAASGHVYAVGTIGSIVGAFATTYLLIPTLSIAYIAFIFGMAAVAMTFLLTLTAPTASRWETVASVLVALCLVAAIAGGSAGLAVQGHVIYETQTPYQHLQVADHDGTRTLYLNGQRHSAMDLSDPDRHVYEYTRYFHLPFLFESPEKIDRVLFIGGGGFTGPKHFAAEYNATVDVVEIDPEVVDVGKRYFSVAESDRLQIHTMDGRTFLRQTNQTYDLIVLDAYKKDKVPFHLTTVEFMRLANQRLSADGILFANVISAPSGPGSQFYRAELKTMQQVFPHVYSFPTANGAVVQNIELIATKNETVVTQSQLHARNNRRAIGLDLETAITNYDRSVPTADALVLRDDRAPVDRLLDSLVGRRYVIQETAPRNTSRRSETLVSEQVMRPG